MDEKPTHEELEKRVRKLERDAFKYKQAEKALRQSEMKYRLLAESATDVICVISLDRFVINYVSPSVESVFGYTFEELMNLNIYDFLTPDSANHVVAILEKEIEKDRHGQAEPQRLEIEVLCKDGSTVWAEVSARFLRDDKNQIISILCVLRDVSERKKLEDELLENKEKFQSLYNNAPDMYFTVSPDGIIISVNQFGAHYLGYSVDELAGNLVRKIVYKDDLRAVQNQLSEIFDQKLQESELEFRKIRKDGSILWVHERTRLILDENDFPTELWIICRDVTIQKKAEIELRNSEEKYRNLIDKLDDIIWILDLNLRTTYVSPSIEKKLGFTPEERMAQDPSEQMTPSSYAHVIELLTQELNREKEIGVDPNRIVRVEVEYYHKNSSTLWTENIVSGLRDENGILVGIHGVSRDITKRKQLEKRLRQAQKMEAIGTLAGGIAHEFNNMLGIILGNAELAIADVPEWNPAKHCLEDIRTASLRAADVVRQILSFARKMPITYKPLQISIIIKESLRLIRATIPKSIELRREVLCNSEMILSNPTEINQVFMNLCSNAVHAMEEETGILEVRLEATILNDHSAAQYEDLTAGRYVKLTIKDTGEGMDPEIKDRIFDPYFTTKSVDKGSGMGLAVVFGIVKRHNGAIKIMSEVGQGTTAEVLLPVNDVPKETEVEESNNLPSGTESILFVDDEPSLLKMAKQMLERQGYKVIEKISSTEALKLFREEPDKFDLVITDMAMPGMAGDRFVKEIMKIQPNIPIILCTGHSDRMDEEKAKELGIKAYTMKPFDHKGLVKMVREVLNKTKS